MPKRKGLLVVGMCVSLVSAACGDDDGDTNNNQNNANGSLCGDGVLDPGELCDDGAQNSDTTRDACRTDCRTAYCGDGVLDTAEQCDEGQANSDLIPGACRTDCRRAWCGDGVIDPGEVCDDGDSLDGNGCGSDCDVEPAYQCHGVPSVCSCAVYRSGSSCEQCVVFVSHDISWSP